MAKFPKLTIFTDALIGDTTHLSQAEFGAYMLMLIVCWRTSDCRLPNDDNYLRRITRSEKNWPRIKAAVMAFWSVDKDGCLFQKRLTKERLAAAEIHNRMSAAGRANALKRWNGDMPRDMQMAVQPHADGIAPNPIPIEVSKNLLNGDGYKNKNWLGNDAVSVPERAERLVRFQHKLAKQIDTMVGAGGDLIVAAALDPANTQHDRCLALCQQAARVLGKGWPMDWK